MLLFSNLISSRQEISQDAKSSSQKLHFNIPTQTPSTQTNQNDKIIHEISSLLNSQAADLYTEVNNLVQQKQRLDQQMGQISKILESKEYITQQFERISSLLKNPSDPAGVVSKLIADQVLIDKIRELFGNPSDLFSVISKQHATSEIHGKMLEEMTNRFKSLKYIKLKSLPKIFDNPQIFPNILSRFFELIETNADIVSQLSTQFNLTENIKSEISKLINEVQQYSQICSLFESSSNIQNEISTLLEQKAYLNQNFEEVSSRVKENELLHQQFQKISSLLDSPSDLVTAVSLLVSEKDLISQIRSLFGNPPDLLAAISPLVPMNMNN